MHIEVPAISGALLKKLLGNAVATAFMHNYMKIM